MVHGFQTTRWSLIVAAGERSSGDARQALGELCEAYWFPLYAFVRRQGYDADRARDLTQAYFVAFLERDYLADVHPQAGRFRSFLLASLRHFLSKQRVRERAAKRGGGKVVLAIDLREAEARFLAERVDDNSPEIAFERQWATTILDRAAAKLAAEAERSGKAGLFACVEGHLTGARDAAEYGEIAARLGMTTGAVKVAVHRARRRFGELLRAEIAETVADPGEIDAELRHLLEILKR